MHTKESILAARQTVKSPNLKRALVFAAAHAPSEDRSQHAPGTRLRTNRFSKGFSRAFTNAWSKNTF